ncbi:MAG: DUF1223 domain-containing protein [Gammaproteobacteria bacterium]
MFKARIPVFVLVLLVSGHLAASTGSGQLVFSSGEQRVPLIELFTSEGCSSCPPADRWLSGLKRDPGLWKTFVPVAFHVDYWDYIGWKDRFARTEFGERHRQYALEGGARAVYTPGLFRQGQDWQGWRRGQMPPRDEPVVGDLRLVIDGEAIAIRFNGGNPGRKGLTVHLAVLGMNLETSVRAGENNGRILRHDFVALEVVAVPLEKRAAGYTANAALPRAGSQAQDLTLIAWVSEDGRQTPIQAVGGYLPQP